MREAENQDEIEPSPPRFELEQASDYSKFLLHSKSEILAVLRALIQKGAMITAHFDQGRSFLLTSMLALTENHQFILDIASDAEMNRRALKADKLIFTTVIDKVKVQFSLNQLNSIQHDGRSAFLGDIPATLLRLQRREYFRLSIPIAKPVHLNTCVKRDDDSTIEFELSLWDISGGGIGLVATPEQAELFQKGDTLIGCKILLPDEGLLVVNLYIRNMFETSNRSGARLIRVGCEFTGVSAAHLSIVQRYITRVERERKARLSGMS